MPATHVRTCPLCEATCGLELTIDAGKITRIRGDKDDVFSAGFICPKGTTLGALHEDPDRLRRPLVRDGEGFREASWEEAFELVDRGLTRVIEERGRDAVALYAGNPAAHGHELPFMLVPLVKALATKNFYTASTVDQMPKHVSCGLMFGAPLMIPVPDLDRTHYLMMLGANPWVSNGSLCTAPDFPGRLKAIQKRGGRVVVVDPRRTKTAEEADEHLAIRPGSDVFFLLSIAHVLFSENMVRIGRLEPHVAGVETVREIARDYTPGETAPVTGIPAETTVRVARELAAAPSAAVYDRIGAHTVEFGTLTSWMSDTLNALTGNLDREGGKMFPLPPHARVDGDSPGGRGFQIARWRSRVRGLPEAFGQLPVAALADEIETPGEGQIRALVTIAGNPAVSNPNAGRLARALSTLEFMVAVDPYLNETTRHANVILPPSGPLARAHYDVGFYALSVRNVANYSPPLFDPDGPGDWEIVARLALVAFGAARGGTGVVGADPASVPRLALQEMIDREVRSPSSPVHGRDPAEIQEALGDRPPVEKILDFRLRAGPFGDGFGARPGGLSLRMLEENPHGVDLGPLTPQLPGRIRTPSGKVELAPPEVVVDTERLRRGFQERRTRNGALVLVGRRHLRSNNSWMHNVPALVGGSNRCTLQVHPGDAARLGLLDGAPALVRSRAGEIEVPVEITDAILPGVVSLPHGWGHDAPGIQLTVAAKHAGSNSNVLTDESVIDELSGNAVLNAIPVEVAAV